MSNSKEIDLAVRGRGKPFAQAKVYEDGSVIVSAYDDVTASFWMRITITRNQLIYLCQEATDGNGAVLTLRDEFAKAALQGMLAADGNDPRWTGKDTGPDCQRGGGKWLDPAGVAQQAYEIADAMILAAKPVPQEQSI